MERTLAEVGHIVTKRRAELGYDAAELARLADVDPKTLASLEKGERWPRDRSRSRIEAALRWTIGSLTEIRKGGTASVSGVIRGRTGLIEQFTAIDGSEQDNLRRLRLGAIIMDARDLVQSQPGPLMTALASILDEASDLVIKVLAEDDDDVADARWRIDQVRAGNSIRRQGDVYVAEYSEVDVVRPLRPASGQGDGPERDQGETVSWEGSGAEAYRAAARRFNESGEELAASLEDLRTSGNAESPEEADDLPLAARTSPPRYRKGQSEQGEAGGEENQDPGSSK